MKAEPTETDPPKRRRRWFQFRLRTLMIVVTLLAVPCAYVASQLKIVRERQAMLKRIRINEKGVLLFANDYVTSPPSPPVEIPWIRSLLGDRAVKIIFLHITTSLAKRHEVHAVIPEADIQAMRTPNDPKTKQIEFIDPESP